MALTYQRGDPSQPMGHAFLYFGAQGSQQVLATYVVVAPIELDVAKYVPPLLASAIGTAGSAVQAAFLPIPPVPEPMELVQVLGLAELRDDDVLAGGPARSDEATSLLEHVVEIGTEYAQAYHDSISQGSTAREKASESEEQVKETSQVRSLMYATLSEAERVAALARELGSLRYGLEGGDPQLVEDRLYEIRAIAGSLPGKYRTEELMAVATRTDPLSLRLAQLFLERSYKLSAENYDAIASIDAEIEDLNRSRTGGD